jgi:hypothetical protein
MLGKVHAKVSIRGCLMLDAVQDVPGLSNRNVMGVRLATWLNQSARVLRFSSSPC